MWLPVAEAGYSYGYENESKTIKGLIFMERETSPKTTKIGSQQNFLQLWYPCLFEIMQVDDNFL